MTLQSPTATLIPLFSSLELTGCGYPGLLDRKNHSDMCPRWESNPRLPACKASTLPTRPGCPPLVQDAYSVHPIYTIFKVYNSSCTQVGRDLIGRVKSSPKQIKITASICKHILCDDGIASCSGIDASMQ